MINPIAVSDESRRLVDDALSAERHLSMVLRDYSACDHEWGIVRTTQTQTRAALLAHIASIEAELEEARKEIDGLHMDAAGESI